VSDQDETLGSVLVTNLVGRQRELDSVSQLLRRPSPRLVTLAGPGGSGKTRLALELARSLSNQFRDGAVFISLADLDDPRHLASEIGRALGFVDLPGEHPTDRLVAGLRSQHLLLVLDNFEHLVTVASVVTEVMSRCRELSVLVTSRRRLGQPGEEVVDITGLALPAPTDTDPAVLGQSAAVELFLQRAAAVSPTFAADETQLRAVGELCRMLDGLPLAIELVASYCRVLSVDALLGRLADRSDSLALYDTIQWSYDLLSDTAAALLPRLGVFHDGWSLDAMEAVCGTGDESDRTSSLLDALVELIDLHLVEPISRPDGELRFRLLETVRRFALDRIEGGVDDDGERLPDRHADHFRGVAIRIGTDFQSPRAPGALAEIDREWSNIRAALEHLDKTGRSSEGLEAVVALCPFWTDHGPLVEGHQWLRRFLPNVVATGALFAIADAWDARMSFSNTLDLPEPSVVDALDARFRAAQATLEATGDWWGWWRIGFHRLAVMHFCGRYDEFERTVTEILERSSDETRWVKAEVLLFWSESLRERGLRQRAIEMTEQTIDLARAVRHERVLGGALAAYASFSGVESAAAARAELEPVFSIALDIGDRRGASITGGIAGLLALIEGDNRSAAMWFRRVIDIGIAIGWPTAQARGLAGTVAVSAIEGRWTEAAQMHGAFRHHGERMRRGLPPDGLALYDALCAQIAEQLGEQFEIECQRGVDAGWDSALELARRLSIELGPSGDAEQEPRRRRRGPRANPELTDRELDVLAELVAGRTNQQIGDQLRISPKTVMHHTMNVYRKLGVRGRAEAVAHALRTGLISV
jgi:predicted ATPase/DNA-binding CsgD family transcriptional regulator